MEKYYCPVNAWDCPYFKDDCECTIGDPMKECDDYYAMMECLEDTNPLHIYIFGGIN